MSCLNARHIALSGRLGTRLPARLILFSLAGIIVGCGGATPTGEDTSSPPPTAAVLDFSPIAGEWVGEVTESVLDRFITYDATITLEEAAQANRRIGLYAYGPAQDPIDPPGVVSQDCGGSLVALDVDGSIYEVEEFLTYGQERCRDGVIRFDHDEAEDTLAYRWYTDAGELHATALLTRNQ